MIKYRTAVLLFSVLLILGLNAMGIGRVYAAPQAVEKPFDAAQSAGQEPAGGQRNTAAEVVEESPTPLAQPINGRNGPSPLMLCGIAAVVVAAVIAAVILRKARKFE